MFRPIRTLISLAFVSGLVWFSFNVSLGPKTLAQHLDAIGQTSQAHELMDGARQTVNPALEEAKQRVLGEHVEAPTFIPTEPAATNQPSAQVKPARAPSAPAEARLPGQSG